MRIGIFGGTFDPIHLGHLILAEQCREQAGLDQVVFVPAARPPHKPQRQLTPFEKRVEMLSLAIAGHPAFRIDELEKDRAGPSFTADTLALFHQRQPDAELFLVLGSDTLQDLPHWHAPAKVCELAAFLVVPRPDWVMPSETELRAGLHLPEHIPVRQQVIQVPVIGIASRDLRRRAAEGRSLRYLVSPAVAIYIQEKCLYRDKG